MSEMEEYMRISVQLAKFFNNNHFADSNEILTALLLKRKRIIHKAENKLEVFRNILEQRFQEKGNLKYTLVYVPEGLKPDTAMQTFTMIQTSYKTMTIPKSSSMNIPL